MLTHILAFKLIFFFFNATATTEIYTLSLHDALPISQLVHDESGERQARDGELGERPCRAPADVGCLHERVDEEQHAAGDEEGAERVEVGQGCWLAALLLEQEEGADEGDRAERDVDEQHPAPAGPLGEQAAEEDAGGAADAGDRSPDTEGRVAVTRGSEGARQGRQRRR